MVDEEELQRALLGGEGDELDRWLAVASSRQINRSGMLKSAAPEPSEMMEILFAASSGSVDRVRVWSSMQLPMLPNCGARRYDANRPVPSEMPH